MLSAIEAGDYAFRFADVNLNRVKDIIVREKEDAARREQYYGLILDSARTGIMVVSPSGVIKQTNAEAHRLLRLKVLTHLNQLGRLEPGLPDIFKEMGAGERRRISFSDERGEVTLAVNCSTMVLRDSEVKVFAISEIGSELAEQETESWVRLIRVLTHEIMNSISPITSLSETLMDAEGLSDEVRRGLETIHATGKGLTAFVDSYRQLTRLPEPRPVLVEVRPLLERAVRLVEQEFEGMRVEVKVEPDDIMLYADENQVFQVVVNLLKNAAQAVAGRTDGEIKVTARCPAGEQVIISITDNGPGIAAEVLPQIFIPFFTTKDAGSGIGLSLSRQIMRLHGAQLTVRSVPGQTTFSMVFP